MSAAANAAGWLCVHNLIPLERKVEQERWPHVAEELEPVHEYQLQPEQPPARKVMVTYRKRKMLEHA